MRVLRRGAAGGEDRGKRSGGSWGCSGMMCRRRRGSGKGRKRSKRYERRRRIGENYRIICKNFLMWALLIKIN